MVTRQLQLFARYTAALLCIFFLAATAGAYLSYFLSHFDWLYPEGRFFPAFWGFLLYTAENWFYSFIFYCGYPTDLWSSFGNFPSRLLSSFVLWVPPCCVIFWSDIQVLFACAWVLCIFSVDYPIHCRYCRFVQASRHLCYSAVYMGKLPLACCLTHHSNHSTVRDQ